MRVKTVIKFMSMIMTMSILVSCMDKKSENDMETIEYVAKNSNGEKTVLELWSYYGGMEELIGAFEKEYPDIKIDLKTFEFKDYELKYKKSLLKEAGDADLLIIDSNDYGSFNSIDGLENLLNSEYNANNYKKDFDPELWELGKSLDKSELVGIPLSSAPIVTYYRVDILEKYGYPTEPKELSNFMKVEENWLEMGKKLSEDGIYTVQWLGEIIKIATSDMPYFNENLEYQRDNDRFENAISITKRVDTSGMAATTDIWSDKGIQLLKEDKFAMLYLGSWGSNELKAIVPEQSGKWRATSLPFGVYGWNNSSIISMAENSENKEAAWKFIEFCNFKYRCAESVGSVVGYLPFREDMNKTNYKNDFLGGQKEQQLYEEIMSKTKEYLVTPLDSKAFKIWDNIVKLGIGDDQTTKQIMENIRNAMNTDFNKEKEIILNGNKK